MSNLQINLDNVPASVIPSYNYYRPEHLESEDSLFSNVDSPESSIDLFNKELSIEPMKIPSDNPQFTPENSLFLDPTFNEVIEPSIEPVKIPSNGVDFLPDDSLDVERSSNNAKEASTEPVKYPSYGTEFTPSPTPTDSYVPDDPNDYNTNIMTDGRPRAKQAESHHKDDTGY